MNKYMYWKMHLRGIQLVFKNIECQRQLLFFPYNSEIFSFCYKNVEKNKYNKNQLNFSRIETYRRFILYTPAALIQLYDSLTAWKQEKNHDSIVSISQFPWKTTHTHTHTYTDWHETPVNPSSILQSYSQTPSDNSVTVVTSAFHGSQRVRRVHLKSGCSILPVSFVLKVFHPASRTHTSVSSIKWWMRTVLRSWIPL